MKKKSRRIRPLKLQKTFYPSILPIVASIMMRSIISTSFQTDWTLHKATFFPLQDCSLVLHILEQEGFLKKLDANVYTVNETVILRCANCSEKYDPTTSKSLKDVEKWLETTEGPISIHTS